MVVGSWEWDLSSNRFTVSEALREVFAATDGEPWHYQAFLQRVAPVDRHRVDRELRASLAEGQPYSDEFRIGHPDGSVRRLHTAGRPVPGADGEAERIRGITVEVTDRSPAR